MKESGKEVIVSNVLSGIDKNQQRKGRIGIMKGWLDFEGGQLQGGYR